MLDISSTPILSVTEKTERERQNPVNETPFGGRYGTPVSLTDTSPGVSLFDSGDGFGYTR